MASDVCNQNKSTSQVHTTVIYAFCIHASFPPPPPFFTSPSASFSVRVNALCLYLAFLRKKNLRMFVIWFSSVQGPPLEASCTNIVISAAEETDTFKRSFMPGDCHSWWCKGWGPAQKGKKPAIDLADPSVSISLSRI